MVLDNLLGFLLTTEKWRPLVIVKYLEIVTFLHLLHVQLVDLPHLGLGFHFAIRLKLRIHRHGIFAR